MASYKGSLRRFEILSKFVLWIITLTLSAFLINLGDKVLSDFDTWFKAPQMEDFANEKALSEIDKKEKPLDDKLKALDEKKYRIQKTLQRARRGYYSEKKSFENWLEARKTIGSPTEDKQVISRANELDRYRRVEQAWQKKLDAFEESVRKINEKKAKLAEEKERIREEDEEKYYEAYKAYLIKIFFMRLALVLPILGTGIFIFIKFRKSKVKPLVYGYCIFALYAFFIGLVPYLPSFGGYIRYTVGILLTVFLGYYIVKQLAKYTEKKKAELQETVEERSKKIDHETALKAYQSHCCPSCEKDFLMNKWRPKTKALSDVVLEEEALSFCRHCGLVLFEKCKSCGHRNFVHFPFCSNCGADSQTEDES